jgi:DNA-binding protein HU-beta
MATISKADLIKTVAGKTSVSAKDAKTVIDAFLDQTGAHLRQGDKVQMTGFGTFEVRERQAREGVRPGTSEKIQIPASKYPAFKAGKGLKDSLK